MTRQVTKEALITLLLSELKRRSVRVKGGHETRTGQGKVFSRQVVLVIFKMDRTLLKAYEEKETFPVRTSQN